MERDTTREGCWHVLIEGAVVLGSGRETSSLQAAKLLNLVTFGFMSKHTVYSIHSLQTLRHCKLDSSMILPSINYKFFTHAEKMRAHVRFFR